jgi:hypothetical protein
MSATCRSLAEQKARTLLKASDFPIASCKEHQPEDPIHLSQLCPATQALTAQARHARTKHRQRRAQHTAAAPTTSTPPPRPPHPPGPSTQTPLADQRAKMPRLPALTRATAPGLTTIPPLAHRTLLVQPLVSHLASCGLAKRLTQLRKKRSLTYF